jgi:hypothetical protein
MIEAVINEKTGKHFILIEDLPGGRYKVINPNGEIITLPDTLFEEDQVTIGVKDYGQSFSDEQLKTLETFNEEVTKKQEWQDKTAKVAASTPQKIAPKRKSTPAQKGTRAGLAASWESSKLTFYKHKIDPLHPKQTFKVEIPSLGEVEISKEQFLSDFNDVVMSAKYRSDGLFSYPQFPEKAKKFIKRLKV